MQRRFHAVAVKGGAGAEEGDFVSSREAPQHAPIGIVLRSEGTAVVETNWRAAARAGDLSIPHDQTVLSKQMVPLAARFLAVPCPQIRTRAACHQAEPDPAVHLPHL